MAIRVNARRFTVTTAALGDVHFRGLNFGDLQHFEKLKLDEFSPAQFLDEVICRVGSKAETDPLTQEDVGRFTPDERAEAVAGLLREHDHFFRESKTESSEDEEGNIVVVAKEGDVVLPREDGETDEAYFLRGYQHDQRRFAESMRKMMTSVTSQLSGFNDAMKKSLAPSLLANASASKRLADQIRDITAPTQRLMDQVRRVTRPLEGVRVPPPANAKPASIVPPEFRPISIPPNPVHETNSLLSDMADEIGQMRELAATTAEMQRSLNDVASNILTEFGKGAAASQKATADGLRTAKIGLGVALASLVVTFIAIVASIMVANYQDQRAAAREGERDRITDTQRARALEAERAHTEALTRNAEAVERQNELALRPPVASPRNERR